MSQRVNEYNQPIGEEVVSWEKRKFPGDIRYVGDYAVIYKNRTRDTCWFSMLQEEWPVVKQAFTSWLARENFDDNGMQIQKLQAFR